MHLARLIKLLMTSIAKSIASTSSIDRMTSIHVRLIYALDSVQMSCSLDAYLPLISLLLVTANNATTASGSELDQ